MYGMQPMTEAMIHVVATMKKVSRGFISMLLRSSLLIRRSTPPVTKHTIITRAKALTDDLSPYIRAVASGSARKAPIRFRNNA